MDAVCDKKRKASNAQAMIFDHITRRSGGVCSELSLGELKSELHGQVDGAARYVRPVGIPARGWHFAP